MTPMYPFEVDYFGCEIDTFDEVIYMVAKDFVQDALATR